LNIFVDRIRRRSEVQVRITEKGTPLRIKLPVELADKIRERAEKATKPGIPCTNSAIVIELLEKALAEEKEHGS
jgi:hypothetical protein